MSITMAGLNMRLMKSLTAFGLALATMTLPAAGSLVGHWQLNEGNGVSLSDRSTPQRQVQAGAPPPQFLSMQ